MMVGYVRRHTTLLSYLSTTGGALEGPWASVEVQPRPKPKTVAQAETTEEALYKQRRMEAIVSTLYFAAVRDTDTELLRKMPLPDVMVYAAVVNPAVGLALAPKFREMAVRAPLGMLMAFWDHTASSSSTHAV
jgi:hypothetical protein